MTDAAESLAKEASLPFWHLRTVRGATIISLALVFAPVLPWDWMDAVRPAALILLPLLATLFLAILWRLRRAPYRDGLAPAAAVGTTLFLLTGLGALISLLDPRPDWQLGAFLGLFSATQAILAGAALGGYRRLGYSRTDWTVVPTASMPPVPPELVAGLRTRIQVVRATAVCSMLLFCATVPPWRWLAEPLAPFLIVLLLFPFVLILWRLRKMPRKDGLTLALGTGGLLFLGAGSVLFGLWGSSLVVWQALFWLAVFAAVEGILAASAIAGYAGLGWAKGDWKLLVRGIVDPLVYFIVVGILSAAALRLAF